MLQSRDSSVGIATRLWAGRLGFSGIFLSTTASRTVLEPTQSPIKWVPVAVTLGVKRLQHEADRSPLTTTEVQECVKLYLHSAIRLHDVVVS